MQTKLNENQIRLSGAYKVIDRLYDNPNPTLIPDIFHKRISSGLKHNLAIFYNKTVQDQIQPCLCGWGDNSLQQLGIDLTGNSEASFESPRPIFLEYRKNQYYPLSVSSGLNHSLILAVRSALVEEHQKALNDIEIQSKMGINQQEIMDQLKNDFMEDIKLFYTGRIEYSDLQNQDLCIYEFKQQKQEDYIENFDNGMSIQIKNPDHVNVISNFNSPMESATNLPLLEDVHSENKKITIQLTPNQEIQQLQKQNYLTSKMKTIKRALSREDDSIYLNTPKNNQMYRDSFEINIQSNTKVDYRFIIDEVVEITQIKGFSMFSVIQIACGWSFCMILTRSHQLFSWGDNRSGNLGLGDTRYRIKPSLVLLEFGKPFQVRFIDCQAQHSAAIQLDGKLYTWGQGLNGQLGINAQSNMLLPQRVGGILEQKNITQVSCGVFHMACITNDGFCYTWGSNTNGQLGLDKDLPQINYPCVVERLQSYFIIQVTCGYNNTFFFSQNGRLYGCGSNQHNKIGLDYNNYSKNSKNIYLPVELNNTFLKGVSFSKINDLYIYQIQSSFHSTFALSNKGYLTSWGLNVQGILGRKISTFSSQELCGLDIDYDDKVEGYIPQRYENSFIPNRVQIDYLGFNQQIFVPIYNQQLYRAKKRDFISSEFVDVQLGTFHSMALTNAGELYIWGSNESSQHAVDDLQIEQAYVDQAISKIKINVQTLVTSSLPSLVNFFDIKENRRVSFIACGAEYCMAIENRRKVYGWGKNDQGQLGIGAISTIVHKPTEVQGLEGLLMKQVACGQVHTLFLSEEGCVYSCGSPTDGKLGLGKRDAIQLFPMKIQSLAKIDKVACGYTHSLALGEDVYVDEDFDDFNLLQNEFNKKVVYSWGSAYESKLGHGEKENLFEPNRIQANFSFRDIFAGGHHSAAIDKEHNLIVWGPYIYFGYQKPEEKNKKNYRQDVNEFIRPTLHPRQQLIQQVQKVALGDKYSIVLNNINQIFQWGVFDKTYENKCKENPNLTRNQINESLMINIQKINAPSSTITQIAVANNHAALISKNQLYTWGYDMNTGRLSQGYEFYDQQLEEQKMIDDVYQEDQQENQQKEKAQITDLNNLVEHPQSCQYLNRFMFDKLNIFNTLQKQKHAQLKKKQHHKIQNFEQNKYKESYNDLPQDFQVEEEIEEDDEDGIGVKDIEEDVMADFNDLEKKKRRDQLRKQTEIRIKKQEQRQKQHQLSIQQQQQQTSIQVKSSDIRKRTFMKPSTYKTILYESSMVEQSQSKILGSFNQNTKEFKKFKTLEKMYKTSKNNSPAEKNKMDLSLSLQKHQIVQIDINDFYTDPIRNNTLYQEIMLQGKPELMALIKDEDGYGIFAFNNIINLYDKVLNIQNEVKMDFSKYKEYMEQQIKMKTVIQSKIFKRIQEPPFQISEKSNEKNIISEAYLNHKLSYSYLLTQLTTHPCYLIKIYESKKMKEDDFFNIVKDIFNEIESNTRLQKVYIDICKKVLHLDIRKKSLKNSNFSLDLNKDTSLSYTFVKLFQLLYESFTQNMLINRNFRIFLRQKVLDYCSSDTGSNSIIQQTLFVLKKDIIINIHGHSNEEIIKSVCIQNAYKITQFFDQILPLLNFNANKNDTTIKGALPEKIRELIQFSSDMILKKIGEENEDKLNQKFLYMITSNIFNYCEQNIDRSNLLLKYNFDSIISIFRQFINGDLGESQSEEYQVINTYIKAKEIEKDIIYKKLMGKKKQRKINNGYENITEVYTGSTKYQDDKILVNLSTLSKLTKFLHKNPIYLKQNSSEDFIFQLIEQLSKDTTSFIYQELDQKDEKRVCVKLKNRLFYHFETEGFKRCTDCGIYLPQSHLKSSDHNLIERFLIYNPEEIESLAIQFIKRIPNKSTYDQIFGGKIQFEQFINKQISNFYREGQILDAKALQNFKKKFDNYILQKQNEESYDFESAQQKNPQLEYLQSLKRLLDKKTMQILSYYQKMQSLYRVFFELRKSLQDQIKLIPVKKGQQFLILNNCHFGLANTELQQLLDSNPNSVIEKVQSQLHSKDMSKDIYANIDFFSKHNLNKVIQNIKNQNMSGDFVSIYMFGEYSYNSLKLKKVVKQIDDKIITYISEYVGFKKIKSVEQIEDCLFYIISNFEKNKITIDAVYKEQGSSILNAICGGKKFKQFRIDHFTITPDQLKDMRKQSLTQEGSKLNLKLGYTTFLLKGFLKLIGKIEDNKTIYQQIYISNSL
ncbi:chromosome condensation regulator RCC1 repeat protein (macronuclear) [Tetrahymena thermophila SB210]|uniref:Chromosome condensation regulator RCC1 repeat protein n=1 Tax=Tetrahymena thermophila (strain SB210) TaxID=312017 RepID=W7XID0_TETTS|nr:chromosome condensation regulator RCC1 repeat protein [Tetrahymena thermophila SB210]EWS73194.1 chromosome condensation regulator RCC1 repeat protein [Tetrahymena thermophila SB210]|eukprot:XP_012654270.1 chromosome condensation regulator RCC1 repeat protein [Tetrahymena thermophila SB210]